MGSSNSVAKTAQLGYQGLRWYAYEPGRMYAFSLLHFYHHELAYEAELSGYEIGDCEMEPSDKQQLQRSLELVVIYLKRALELDIVFGDKGISLHSSRQPPGIAACFLSGISSAEQALDMLTANSYNLVSLSIPLANVSHAVNTLSTAIASYQNMRSNYLL